MLDLELIKATDECCSAFKTVTLISSSPDRWSLVSFGSLFVVLGFPQRISVMRLACSGYGTPSL
jgi:hypothetical protein